MTLVANGGRTSLIIGFATAIGSITIGTFVGVIAGFLGGKIDSFLMRLADVFLMIPSLFVILFLARIFQGEGGGGVWSLVIVFVGFGWMGLARLVRGQVLAIREMEFVEAARSFRLELAADYLVMAAWLAYLKSRLLLPEPSKGEEPPAEELAQRGVDVRLIVGPTAEAVPPYVATTRVRSFDEYRDVVLREASVAAALLSERDPFRTPRGGGPRDRHTVRTRSDVVDRVAALQAFRTGIPIGDPGLEPHPGGAHNVLRVAEQLYHLVDVPLADRAADPAAACAEEPSPEDCRAEGPGDGRESAAPTPGFEAASWSCSDSADPLGTTLAEPPDAVGPPTALEVPRATPSQ
jgi:hypothetical protein